MGVRFSEWQINPEPDARAIALRFGLENRSEDAWRCEDHYYVAWQLMDPETGTFISEGRWIPLEYGMEPGEKVVVKVSVELPREPGRYHVYVSLLSESAGWFYSLGWPFLLVDARVEEGRAQVLDTRVTTTAGLRRARMLGSLHRVLTLPVTTLWDHRRLIRSMVRRDIAARYRGSLGDVLWTVLNPLLLMLTYFFVFGVVLQARFGTDPSRSGFALYFLAGMLPWLPLSEAVARSPVVILEHQNFVKKLLFPVQILPSNLALAGLVTGVFALGVFLVMLLLTRGSVPVSAVWLPVLLVPQLMLTLGLCWFLAATGVFVRDLSQVIGFLLTLWFFLTPICYPESALPAAAIPILEKNPLFVLVRGYRAIFLEGSAPAFGPLWKLWVVSALVFVAGRAWFHKLRRSFADVI